MSAISKNTKRIYRRVVKLTVTVECKRNSCRPVSCTVNCRNTNDCPQVDCCLDCEHKILVIGV